MSSFTQFDKELNIQYSTKASNVLKKDYWHTVEGFIYYIGSLNSNRFVVVPRGFLSDGASVPRLLRPLVHPMGRNSQAAFLHDYLTETYMISVKDPETGEVRQQLVDRKMVDEIFYEALTVLGVDKFEMFWIKLGVDIHRILRNPKYSPVDADKVRLELEFRKKLEQFA